jgi:hypothetical protein
MMTRSTSAALASLSLLAGLMTAAPAAAQEAGPATARLDGKWKLVVLARGEDEFAIITLATREGRTTGEAIATAKGILGESTVREVTRTDGLLTVPLETTNGPVTFAGKLPADGSPIRGLFTMRGSKYPARLVRTDADTLAPMDAAAMTRRMTMMNVQEQEPKARFQKLVQLIRENPDSPIMASVYTTALGSAERAEATPDEVEGLIRDWSAMMAPYSPALADEARVHALAAIDGQKSYAPLVLRLAKDAEAKLAADAPVADRLDVVKLLAHAADLTGDKALAEETGARVTKLEGELDADYLKRVPPYQVKAFAGRKDSAATRVVLMELFTGAQCPPCVAADVGFDGLLQTYKPAEFVGLQYHLHIPGPDPMTNPATMDRAKYYAVRSTPSTFFNGEAVGRGGGPMGASEGKYQEFRKTIDPALEAKAKAAIDLTVSRDGDKLTIRAAASAESPSSDAKPRLRLVVIEPTIKYVGGNGLRFHHNVVRDLPGGADGVELKDGKAAMDQTVDLAQIRQGIETYLSDYKKSGRTFAGGSTDLAFKHLAVVALVQDDADKSVWHAVMAPASLPGADESH